MKGVKKSIPKIKETTWAQVDYEIQCPHCKTFLQGGFTESTIVYKCNHCGNLIEIKWDESIYVQHF
ncbi:MAG: phage terminase large subunit family protein [Candidatus Omnitrophica bacterium]|jgi:ribosomal protein S27E|nr:phage terminase large subunit family protein [Candidatus Omnitrophota bacterium]